MNLNKSYEFFKPEDCTDRLHIIGCGAIGSTIAENLVRLGLTKLTLYDFDTVEPHNIANQMYYNSDIGIEKVYALSSMLEEINPEVLHDIKLMKNGYQGQPLSGYVFLCIDNIDLRRTVVESCKDNPYIKAIFDFRMRLTDAQHYAADWNDREMVNSLLKSMDFSHEEAIRNTPVSACNMTLSVIPTVRTICALGFSNFINFVKARGLKRLILIDAFSFQTETF